MMVKRINPSLRCLLGKEWNDLTIVYSLFKMPFKTFNFRKFINLVFYIDYSSKLLILFTKTMENYRKL